jgi:arylformamidase
MDYDQAYDNRAAVPEHPQILAQWQKDSAAFRAEAAENARAIFDLRYGGSARQYLDLFLAEDEAAPLAMFIHGGYWRALDPKQMSHVARGLQKRGVSVALAGYDLCPQVTIAAIIEEMREAALFLWRRFRRRIMIYGHSAGGHLSAALLATDWSTLDPQAPADLVPAATSISGLFDLAPLTRTAMNADLRLDEASARAASPLFWPVPGPRLLDSIVGGAELPEFIRQAKAIGEIWPRDKVTLRTTVIPGANHFTVVAPLADPDSNMVQRLLTLARQTDDWRGR